jgi:hypothetical protein
MQFAVADPEDPGNTGTLRVLIAVQTMTLTLRQGWNLISLPLEPDLTDPAELLRHPNGGGPCYTSPIWYFDATAQRFRRATAMTAKLGYWLYCPDELGPPLERDGFAPAPGQPLVAGWNLVGPTGAGATCPLPRQDDGARFPSGCIWHWNGDAYEPPPENLLRAGAAYWIRSARAQTVPMNLD